MTEPTTPGGKYLADALNTSVLGSLSSVEAALANVLYAQDGTVVPNDEVDVNGRLLND